MMKTADFSYQLPDELIARYPMPQRSSSRLLVLNSDDGSVAHRHFFDIADYFRSGDVLVVNNTQVIANLGVCGFLGYASRYSNIINSMSKKILGMSSIIFCIFFAIWFNGVIASFRLEYHQVNDSSLAFINASKSAIGIFQLNFPFTDITSFAFFIVGLFFSLIAFYKGYTLDDAYPGYSAIDKEFKKHKSKYDEIIKRVQPEVTIAEFVRNLQSIVDKVKYFNIESIKAEINGGKISHEHNIATINHRLSRAIETFRSAHLEVLPTDLTSPKHFADYGNFKISPQTLSTELIENLELTTKELGSKYEEIRERIDKQVIPIIRLINLKKPDMAMKVKAKFISEISKEAEEIYNKRIDN
jgi:predicted secreted protein